MILNYIKRIIVIFILMIIIPKVIQATETLINSQLDALNLSSFIKEGQKYTKESFINSSSKYWIGR